MPVLCLADAVNLLRIAVTTVTLLIGAWSDLKRREVSNSLWIVYFPLGATLGLLGAYLEEGWVAYLASVGLSTALSVALFYAGFFGGADAKAIIGVSLTLPYHPSLPPGRATARPIMPGYPFPITVLLNSTLLTVVLVVPLTLSRNILWKLRGPGGALFEGLERESVWKKALALLIGYKVKAKELDRLFVYPIEEIRVGRGGVERRLRLSIRIEEGERLKGLIPRTDQAVWVSPGLPLMASIFLGFLVALLHGDLAFSLSRRMADYIARSI